MFLWGMWVFGHMDPAVHPAGSLQSLTVVRDEWHTDVIFPAPIVLAEDILWPASSKALPMLWSASFGPSIRKPVLQHSALCSTEEQFVWHKWNTSSAFSFGTWDSMSCTQLCGTWHSGTSAHGVSVYLLSQQNELCTSQGNKAEYWSWVPGLSNISGSRWSSAWANTLLCDQYYTGTAARQGTIIYRSCNLRATQCLTRGQRLP